MKTSKIRNHASTNNAKLKFQINFNKILFNSKNIINFSLKKLILVLEKLILVLEKLILVLEKSGLIRKLKFAFTLILEPSSLN